MKELLRLLLISISGFIIVALIIRLPICLFDSDTQCLPTLKLKSSNNQNEQETQKSIVKRFPERNFTLAIESAQSNSILVQSAEYRQEWEIISRNWSQIISTLEEVPKTSENNTKAQEKISEYTKYKEYAESRLTKSLLLPTPSLAYEKRYRKKSPKWKSLMSSLSNSYEYNFAWINENYEYSRYGNFFEVIYRNDKGILLWAILTVKNCGQGTKEGSIDEFYILDKKNNKWHKIKENTFLELKQSNTRGLPSIPTNLEYLCELTRL